MATNVAYIATISGKMVAVAIGAATIEALEGNLNNLTIDRIKALSV